MLIGETPPPWAGAGAAYSVPMVLEQIEKHKTTLIFHNTRAQAEIFFTHFGWKMKQAYPLPFTMDHWTVNNAKRLKPQ